MTDMSTFSYRSIESEASTCSSMSIRAGHTRGVEDGLWRSKLCQIAPTP